MIDFRKSCKNTVSSLVAEFTYPILPAHKWGADWFYSLPEHDVQTLAKVGRFISGKEKPANMKNNP